jgi:hypothetical protein
MKGLLIYITQIHDNGYEIELFLLTPACIKLLLFLSVHKILIQPIKAFPMPLNKKVFRYAA